MRRRSRSRLRGRRSYSTRRVSRRRSGARRIRVGYRM